MITMSEKGKTVRFASKKMDKAQKIAEGSYTSFNGLVEMLIDGAIEYVDREGELPLPLKIVSKRDYERFEAWEAANRHTEGANLNVGLSSAKYEKADKTA